MPVFERLQEVIAEEPSTGPVHMATDEAIYLLNNQPTIRIYSWSRAEITFGFFGDYEQVRTEFPGWPLTRRWTGGGIVEHGDDFTWTLFVPVNENLCRKRGSEIYAELHGRLCMALQEIGVSCELSSGGAPESACFRAAVESDLILEGRKIAGGAMRRTKRGLLYQGSVRVAAEKRKELRRALLQQLAESTNSRPPTSDEQQIARSLVHRRYGNPRWVMFREDQQQAD